jgi:hypothetical protein
MDITAFSDLSFPASSETVFDKMLWIDWYDGITSGLVVDSAIAKAFRLDILAWGPQQQQRIFVLSELDIREFDQVVALLAEETPPTWPTWDPEWPSGNP